MTLRRRHQEFFRHAEGWEPGPLSGDGLDSHAEALAAFAETYLELGPGQRQALDQLLEALWGASGALADRADEPARGAREIGDELAALEAQLAAGLEAVKAARPVYQAFRAALDEAQRAALDDLLAGREELRRQPWRALKAHAAARRAVN